jgi:murein DD-endopeptidase MepM/ murein hydrolase activator NlpD
LFLRDAESDSLQNIVSDDELDKKKQEYSELAKQKAREAENLRSRLESLRRITRQTESQIEFLLAQAERLRKAAAKLDREIARLSFRVDELVRTLRARLINMYKYDAQEGLFLLFGHRNAHEVLESAYLISRLARQNQDIIDELLSKTKMLEQAELELKKNRAQLTALSDTLVAKRAQYDASIAATRALLSNVQWERRRAENAVKTLEQAQHSVDRAVMAVLERKRTRMAMEREAGIENPAARFYPALARGALLDWPLRGPIAVPYGFRVDPVLKTKSFNAGLDIRAASGALVKTAGPGEVLFAGKLKEFGYTVVVDHGGDILTVYTHLSSVRVKEQDAVQAGKPLGKVGKTWASGGYGFHFEVRVGPNRSARDPRDYLKKF